MKVYDREIPRLNKIILQFYNLTKLPLSTTAPSTISHLRCFSLFKFIQLPFITQQHETKEATQPLPNNIILVLKFI